MGSKRQYYGRAQWMKWILECRDSGLTISAWCQLHGISKNSFFKWRRRLIDEGVIEDKPLRADQSDHTTNQGSDADNRFPTVVQVNLESLKTGIDTGHSMTETVKENRNKPFADSQILVETPLQGFRIHLGTGFDQDALRRLLEVVR